MPDSLESAPRQKPLLFPKLASKLASAIVVSTYLGFSGYHDYRSWAMLGKDKFMAHELLRWDRYYLTASPMEILSGAIYIGAVLCIYELIAQGIFKLVSWNWSKQR